jgi:hypothetical protein
MLVITLRTYTTNQLHKRINIKTAIEEARIVKPKIWRVIFDYIKRFEGPQFCTLYKFLYQVIQNAAKIKYHYISQKDCSIMTSGGFKRAAERSTTQY